PEDLEVTYDEVDDGHARNQRAQIVSDRNGTSQHSAAKLYNLPYSYQTDATFFSNITHLTTSYSLLRAVFTCLL
ncbi:hypothetical protein ACJX0J_032237, partial [Zea mays]